MILKTVVCNLPFLKVREECSFAFPEKLEEEGEEMIIDSELLKHGSNQFLAGCFPLYILANWRDVRVEDDGDNWVEIRLDKHLRVIAWNFYFHMYIFRAEE